MDEPRSVFWAGSLASLLAGLGTEIGALWVLVLPRPSARMENALLSAAAGVMLAATFVSLLLPAIQHAQGLARHVELHVAIVLAGLFAGAGALFWAHRHAPHEHFILVEPIGGAIGSAAVWLAAPLMPWMLGFAAGAMLFVISEQIIPETHRSGYENVATFSLLGGFALMIFLDAMLA